MKVEQIWKEGLFPRRGKGETMDDRPVDHVLIDFEGQTGNANVPHKTLLLQLLKGGQSLLDDLHSPTIIGQ